MIDNPPEAASDAWSDWLLHGRHADDPKLAAGLHRQLERCADRVLDAAELEEGMTLADIGSGDGLIVFRALSRIGPSLRLVMSDISQPLLRHVEARAQALGVHDQCRFHHCSADNLAPIADESVDVVTTRAVLAYVTDKTAALREFRRILKPGGRISLAEPILRDEALAVAGLKMQLDARPADHPDKLTPLIHRWRAAQFPDTAEKVAKNPLVNFSERDLVRFAQEAGFPYIHMEFHIDLALHDSTSWETFIGSSPHPFAPSLRTVFATQFTTQEQQLFEQGFRPLVEAPTSTGVNRVAYVVAKKV